MASKKSSSDPLDRSTDLGGMFYPEGHIFAAFSDETRARAVQEQLLASGLSESDCRLYSSERVANMARQELEQNTGFLATLGKSDEALQRDLDAAEQGAWFVLVNAPNDEDAARVSSVLRGAPFTFAHRYHRLAIETIE